MEMLILIKKGVFTQQRLFMVISVLKIKGQVIVKGRNLRGFFFSLIDDYCE